MNTRAIHSTLLGPKSLDRALKNLSVRLDQDLVSPVLGVDLAVPLIVQQFHLWAFGRP